MKKLIYPFVIVLLLSLMSASLADAGGWAVVTLDSMPKEVVAGQPFTISFMVRQHGQTLIAGLKPKITAIHAADGKSEVVYAKAARDTTGKYEATLKLPVAGEWTWSIDAFGAFPQPMPKLNVLASAPAKNTRPVVAATPAPASSALGKVPAWLGWLVGVSGLIATGGALFVWQRKQSGAAFALSILTALVMLGGFAFAALPTAPSQAEAAPSNNSSSAMSATDEAAISPMQYGHDLFLAKGCVVCHAHAAFAAERTSAGIGSFTIGPDLTTRFADAPDKDTAKGYIEKWLFNPSALKPGTEMPTLGLRDDELNALALFLVNYKAK